MKPVHVASAMSLVVSVCLFSSVGRAEEPATLPADGAPPLASAPASPPKDIVHLRSGGIVRGTIVESLPGDAVKIQLVTGEIRTIPYSETTYVGPDTPPAPAPAQVDYASRPRAPVRHMRSPGALAGGITAVVLGQFGVLATFYGLANEKQCESRRDFEFRRDTRIPDATTTDCSQGGLVAGGLVAFAALTSGGVALILYGVKRVPSTDTAVRFVPWAQGPNAGGGSFQVRF